MPDTATRGLLALARLQVLKPEVIHVLIGTAEQFVENLLSRGVRVELALRPASKSLINVLRVEL